MFKIRKRFKIMAICEWQTATFYLNTKKKLKNLLPQIDPKEFNADVGFFLEPVFFQPSDWLINNYFKMRHYVAQIVQNVLLMVLIYFVLSKICSKW